MGVLAVDERSAPPPGMAQPQPLHSRRLHADQMMEKLAEVFPLAEPPPFAGPSARTHISEPKPLITNYVSMFREGVADATSPMVQILSLR